MIFSNRVDAGRQLAEMLRPLATTDVIVLGLHRGGVPVAAEVASALEAPLDVIIVRKLGVPFQPELAMGALGEDGIWVRNDEVVRHAHITEEEFATVEARERTELNRPRRGNFDATATGSTCVARPRSSSMTELPPVRRRGPRARSPAPMALPGSCSPRLWRPPVRLLDSWTTPTRPCFSEYPTISWRSVSSTTTSPRPATPRSPTCSRSSPMGREPLPSAVGPAVDDPPPRDEDITIPDRSVTLEGHLFVPDDAVGIVIFVHGSGSSRHSPRNRYVAGVLNDRVARDLAVRSAHTRRGGSIVRMCSTSNCWPAVSLL